MALDLAQRTGATLMLLSVLTPQHGIDNTAAKGTLREQMLHELGALVADCRDLSIITMVGEGHVGDSICHEAAQHAADLIVMTSHGQSGLHHFALGSVTDKVLHGTQVPVLVMHSLAQYAEAVGAAAGAAFAAVAGATPLRPRM